jgi:hypothetical protein
MEAERLLARAAARTGITRMVLPRSAAPPRQFRPVAKRERRRITPASCANGPAATCTDPSKSACPNGLARTPPRTRYTAAARASPGEPRCKTRPSEVASTPSPSRRPGRRSSAQPPRSLRPVPVRTVEPGAASPIESPYPPPASLRLIGVAGEGNRVAIFVDGAPAGISRPRALPVPADLVPPRAHATTSHLCS